VFTRRLKKSGGLMVFWGASAGATVVLFSWALYSAQRIQPGVPESGIAWGKGCFQFDVDDIHESLSGL
jgi:hypothetical protein